MPKSCHRCDRTEAQDDFIDLWDGHSYCLRCMESEAPQLLHHARLHDELREEMPWSLSREFRSQLRVFLAELVGLNLLLGIYVYATGDMESLILGPLAILLLLMATWLIIGPVSAWHAKRYRPAIAVKDGMVTVRTPARGGAKWATIPLTCFSWYVGRTSHDPFYMAWARRWRPAIILVYVVRWRGWRLFTYRVACGFSPEERAIWEAFFRFIELPKHHGWYVRL